MIVEPILDIGPNKAIALRIILALRGTDVAPQSFGRDAAACAGRGVDRRDAQLVEHRIVMAGNNLPNFGSHAAATAARLLIFPFDVS